MPKPSKQVVPVTAAHRAQIHALKQWAVKQGRINAGIDHGPNPLPSVTSQREHATEPQK